MSGKVYEMIKRHEGSVPYAYQDSLGYWTIGVGRLIDKKMGGGLSPDEIEYLFQNDLKSKQKDLDKALPWWRTLSEVRQAVLLDMCFNLGLGGLLGFKKFLAALQEKNYTLAATHMEQSKWFKQVGNRSIELKSMMINDAWV